MIKKKNDNRYNTQHEYHVNLMSIHNLSHFNIKPLLQYFHGNMNFQIFSNYFYKIQIYILDTDGDLVKVLQH